MRLVRSGCFFIFEQNLFPAKFYILVSQNLSFVGCNGNIVSQKLPVTVST